MGENEVTGEGDKEEGDTMTGRDEAEAEMT